MSAQCHPSEKQVLAFQKLEVEYSHAGSFMLRPANFLSLSNEQKRPALSIFLIQGNSITLLACFTSSFLNSFLS
jgi:hypothetical protein